MEDIIAELEELLSEAHICREMFNEMGDSDRTAEHDAAATELKDHLRNVRWGIEALLDELRQAQP